MRLLLLLLFVLVVVEFVVITAQPAPIGKQERIDLQSQIDELKSINHQLRFELLMLGGRYICS